MTSQKQITSKNAVIIIENTYCDTLSKIDIIKDILINTDCLIGENVIKSSCRNAADYGSQTKEAEN